MPVLHLFPTAAQPNPGAHMQNMQKLPGPACECCVAFLGRAWSLHTYGQHTTGVPAIMLDDCLHHWLTIQLLLLLMLLLLHSKLMMPRAPCCN